MVSSPILDGSMSQESETNTAVLTLSTTLTNDIIVAYISIESASVSLSSIVSTSGLIFIKRGNSVSNSNGSHIECWYAFSSGILSSENITFTISASSTYFVVSAFGVNGCYTALPWDDSTSIPYHETGSSSDPTGLISTNQSDDFLIAATIVELRSQYSTVPTGFTFIRGPYAGPVAQCISYMTVSSTQSLLALTSASTNSSWATISDALTANVHYPPLGKRYSIKSYLIR